MSRYRDRVPDAGEIERTKTRDVLLQIEQAEEKLSEDIELQIHIAGYPHPYPEVGRLGANMVDHLRWSFANGNRAQKLAAAVIVEKEVDLMAEMQAETDAGL